MTLPTPVTYGQVKWRVLTAQADTPGDADALPDAQAVTGFVTFTPSAPVLLARGAAPATILPIPLRYDLDAAGVLRDAEGRDLVTLPATDAPDVSPQGWTWRVDCRFGGLLRPSFSFALPAGSVVDLTTVAPLPTSGGVPIVRGPEGPPGPAGPPGAGAPVFDVRAYGAVGDGVADDHAAILAAVNAATAAGGGVVDLGYGGRPATYRISAALPSRSRVIYAGAGMGVTVLKPYQSHCFDGQGSLAAPIVEPAWQDMTWDGSAIPTTTTYKGQYAIHLIRPRWSRVRCINFTATGFGSDYLVDWLYEGCVAEGNGRGQTVGNPGMSGFGIGTGRYAHEGGLMVGCTGRNNLNFGAFFERQGTDATYMSRGVRVVGCHFEGNQWGLGDCGVEGMVATGNTLVGNTLDGFVSEAGTGAAALGRPGQRGIVSDNVALDNGRHGFHLDYSVYSSNANRAYYQVSGNTADNNAGNGIRIAAGKWASDVLRGVVVAGNTVRGNGASGILVRNTAGGDPGGSAIHDLVLEDNQVLANGQTSGSDPHGIRILAPTTRLTVRGNKVHDDGATKKQSSGLVTDAGFTHTDAYVADNDLRSNLVGAAVLNGTWAGSSEVRNNLGMGSVFGFPATLDTHALRGSDAMALAVNQAVYARVRDGGTITKIALEVGASAGNISVAVYRNTGTGRSASPSTRLATSGSVACPAVGYAEVPLDSSVVVQPGDWLALSADNATASFRCLLAGSANSQLGAGRTLLQDSTGHPLPATPGTRYPVIGKSIVLVGVA